MRQNNASAESVRTCILNESRKLGISHELLMRRYVFERFLVRLSQSDWRDRLERKTGSAAPPEEPCRHEPRKRVISSSDPTMDQRNIVIHRLYSCLPLTKQRHGALPPERRSAIKAKRRGTTSIRKGG
ncbi:hypothetical protein [Bradyrhizobium brasilense]|uniref:hypothetical protein n=1 Tax=Bradyrhizobium brasilense TaxID=1419277 RepID=UPI001E645AFB|nr:hypothetical protein [Bradyrhizobium brasilense]MCC8973198.1 hypothetical protein [Bradyrhizobium brasilense]